MRNIAPYLFSTALAALAGAGCSWTEFDDLEAETWVTALERPSGTASSNWATAMVRGRGASADGGTLIVYGDAAPEYTRIALSSTGDVRLDTSVRLDGLGVAQLETEPLALADPASDNVVMFASSGADQTVAISGVDSIGEQQIFGLSLPSAGAWVDPPPRLDDAALTRAALPIIAGGTHVYPVFLGADAPQLDGGISARCKLVKRGEGGSETEITIVGIAGVKLERTPADNDDLVVWTTEGELLVYDGASTINGSGPPDDRTGVCNEQGVTGPIALSTPVNTGFRPERGSRIVPLDDQHVLLVGRRFTGATEGLLAVYNIDARDPMDNSRVMPALVGGTNTTAGVRTAELLEIVEAIGSPVQRYVVASYPNATVDGVAAGKVEVYPLSLTTGLGLTEMTLYDAQPERGQQFGRSLAIVPYNNGRVIAVGANNEVFTYFRTSLYDETRSGR